MDYSSLWVLGLQSKFKPISFRSVGYVGFSVTRSIIGHISWQQFFTLLASMLATCFQAFHSLSDFLLMLPTSYSTLSFQFFFKLGSIIFASKYRTLIYESTISHYNVLEIESSLTKLGIASRLFEYSQSDNILMDID